MTPACSAPAVVIVPAPGLPAWRLVIDPAARRAALEHRCGGWWLTAWPDVPFPGRVLLVASAGGRRLVRRYELTWRGQTYLPARRELRHVLWQMPGELPPGSERAGLALVRALVAACERDPAAAAGAAAGGR